MRGSGLSKRTVIGLAAGVAVVALAIAGVAVAISRSGGGAGPRGAVGDAAVMKPGPERAGKISGSAEISPQIEAPVSQAPPSSPSPSPTPPPSPAPPPAPANLSDPARKLRAERITSTFESGTTKFDYDFADDIGDGAGITAGRIGFTSKSGSLLAVVREYARRKPGNVVAKYVSTLEKVAGTGSTAGLANFPADWRKANQDPLLHQIQDEKVNSRYFDPAMKLAAQVGLKTALGQAIMWDSVIQHGQTGTQEVIAKTRSATGGDVRNNEGAWLRAFLDQRQARLFAKYTDADRRSGLKSRIDALRSFVDAGKFGLDPVLTWTVYGTRHTLTD